MLRAWPIRSALAALWAAALAAPAWAEAADLKPAGQLLLAGKYAEAQEAFEKAAIDAPARAALGVAECQRATGKDDEALATLERAIAAEAPPAGEAAGVGLDRAALDAAKASLLIDRGRYDEAKAAVKQALADDANQLQAHWLEAELARLDGRLPEADRGYRWLVDYYNAHDVDDPAQLAWIGLGAAQFARWNHLSDQFKFLVNDLYPQTLESEKLFWPAHYAAGQLFLEKYNEADASKEFKAALELNPQAAPVHAALAALAVQNFDLADAQAAIDRALAINPRLLDAHLAQVDVHLSNLELEKASVALRQAREINPLSDGVLGRLAAIYQALDGPAKPGDRGRLGQLLAQVEARNEHAGEFYATVGDAMDTLRRFPGAAENYAEALRCMPQLGDVRGKRGLQLMRLGEEAEARKLLEQAFEADPFNVRVSNTLKVLEVLDGYETLESPHFVIRYDGKRDKLMARYAQRRLEEVYPQLCRQLGFEPPQPSLFEIFNKAKNTDGHGWFSARMVGLPHIHTIGACAGKMVAMQSPTEKGMHFNWARVLKHEFVHVINLQQTNFNIPHWYTEALAVLNEGYPRPQQWNDLLVERVPAGKIFNLDTINLGFIRAHSSDEWALAYCQAELYAEYMLATYGDDALARLLAAYARNLATREALREAFDVAQEDFEQGYRKHLENLVAGLTAHRKSAAARTLSELQKVLAEHPDDADGLAETALAQLNRRGYPEARRLAEKALLAKPKHQLATYVRARLHMVVGEDPQAHELLVGALDETDPQENLLGLLAGLELASERFAEAARLYELGAKANPADVKWVKSLARVYLKAQQNDKLAETLARLAALDADDPTVRKKLAELAHAAHDHAGTMRWAREVLEIDLMDPEIHRWLADALRAEQKPLEAAEEYEATVELQPQEPGVRFLLAESYLDAGQNDKARSALTELLKLDPKYPGADLLLEGLKP